MKATAKLKRKGHEKIKGKARKKIKNESNKGSEKKGTEPAKKQTASFINDEKKSMPGHHEQGRAKPQTTKGGIPHRRVVKGDEQASKGKEGNEKEKEEEGRQRGTKRKMETADGEE